VWVGRGRSAPSPAPHPAAPTRRLPSATFHFMQLAPVWVDASPDSARSAVADIMAARARRGDVDAKEAARIAKDRKRDRDRRERKRDKERKGE
jgi:hypothetical protein